MEKKALIYNPYWATLGGGEKYTAMTVLAFEQAGYIPHIAWHDADLPQKIDHRFAISWNKTKIRPDIFEVMQHSSMTKKFNVERSYDAVFWVSDGSLPVLGSKRNLLHFQVPFSHIQSNRWVNRIKELSYHLVICNSQFTQNVIKRTFGFDSIVVYPPCEPMKSLEKKPYILSVGRFEGLLHSKRQDVLISAFKKLSTSGWELVLAGGSLEADTQLQTLREQSHNWPVRFVINPSHNELAGLYSEASIFWHAAGFKINETNEPEKVEHFGISTVEAMSAGAIPCVYNAGGQKEIINTGINGFVWNTVEELVDQTRKIIDNNVLANSLRSNGQSTSQQFSTENFIHAFTSTCLR